MVKIKVESVYVTKISKRQGIEPFFLACNDGAFDTFQAFLLFIFCIERARIIRRPSRSPQTSWYSWDETRVQRERRMPDKKSSLKQSDLERSHLFEGVERPIVAGQKEGFNPLSL